MPGTATLRLWANRLWWPVTLASCWLVVYTSAVLFNIGFAHYQKGPLQYLFSSQHLSHPYGWAFLLSLVVVLIGIVFYSYARQTGY